MTHFGVAFVTAVCMTIIGGWLFVLMEGKLPYAPETCSEALGGQVYVCKARVVPK